MKITTVFKVVSGIVAVFCTIILIGLISIVIIRPDLANSTSMFFGIGWYSAGAAFSFLGFIYAVAFLE
jgi:hypothetical protein